MKSKISSLNLKSSVLAVLFVLPLALTVAAADNDFDNRNDTRNTQRAVLPENGVNNLTSQQPRVSRGQAMNIASSRYEGRVLGIIMDDNSNNWRVRMDRDGTVFNVFVNASSGAVNASSD